MWKIHLIKNDVEINAKIAEEIFEADSDEDGYSESFESADDVIDHNKLLAFNGDHFEHMDYLWREKIQEVLKRHKVRGEVAFVDLEGDGRGTGWGYRFDGEGGMTEFRGKVGIIEE